MSDASSLRAGSTKTNKVMTMRSGPTTGNISKKNKNKLQNYSKTSQSDKESEFIVVDGKVRTPKRIITERYKSITQQYLKLTEADQQKQKKDKQNLVEPKVKSSFNSATESDFKNSTSNMQEKSELISSGKSQSESESESRKDYGQAEDKKKKKAKELSFEDLEQNVVVSLCQTTTTYTLFLPSSLHTLDNKEKEESNKKYLNYVQQRIGSDNYVNRPVQTFNYQRKQNKQLVEKPGSFDTGVFVAHWDILDTLKQQQKTEYETLQEQLKKSIEKEINSFLSNPFSTLPLDQQAIQIHSKFEVPGAAEYIIKEKDKTKDSRTRGGIANSTTNNQAMREESKQNNQSQAKENSTKNRLQNDGTSGNNTRARMQKANQLQLDNRQEQIEVEKQEANNLRLILDKARKLPKEEVRRVLGNERLSNALKYVDRILNTQNYYKQYILYRNYPEVKFKKADEDAKNKGRKDKNEPKKEQNKETLQQLFKFSCKFTEGYAVTSADWNPVNKDLLAVSYGDLDIESTREGYLMFWTLKNPSFPQKIIVSPTRITTCKFSNDNPNLIACGTYDGVVAIYDIRKKDSKPVAENREVLDKHSDAVWEIQWISKGKGNDKGESLVSISADGRITEWSMKKGLEFTDLMLLRRIPQSNKKDATENMNFRYASGLSFQFLKNESSMYLATTQEGIIYRCSKSYTQQFLELYYGHSGPVYRVRCNPFFADIFLTCSADWSCKLWNWRRDQALNTFQSLDLNDEVIDIEWSPNCSTLFASVCKDGRLQLWDLSKKNMLDPIVILNKNAQDQKFPAKTMVRFSKGAPVLVAGDVAGDVYVYRLNTQQQNLDNEKQALKLMNLLYPNGYSKGNNREEVRATEQA